MNKVDLGALKCIREIKLTAGPPTNYFDINTTKELDMYSFAHVLSSWHGNVCN